MHGFRVRVVRRREGGGGLMSGVPILKGPVDAALLAADSTVKTGSPAWLVAKVAVREVTRGAAGVSEETAGYMERGFLLGALWADGRPEREWRRKLALNAEMLGTLQARLAGGTLGEEGAEQLLEVATEIGKPVSAKKSEWKWVAETKIEGDNA